MTLAFLEQFAHEEGFVGVMRVSAKTGENVAQSFSMLVREVLMREF